MTTDDGRRRRITPPDASANPPRHEPMLRPMATPLPIDRARPASTARTPRRSLRRYCRRKTYPCPKDPYARAPLLQVHLRPSETLPMHRCSGIALPFSAGALEQRRPRCAREAPKPFQRVPRGRRSGRWGLLHARSTSATQTRTLRGQRAPLGRHVGHRSGASLGNRSGHARAPAARVRGPPWVAVLRSLGPHLAQRGLVMPVTATWSSLPH